MSANSVENHITTEEVDQFFCDASYKYLLSKRFKVGGGIDLNNMYLLDVMMRVAERCYQGDCIDGDLVKENIKKLTII
jgi:hypothetical protein